MKNPEITVHVPGLGSRLAIRQSLTALYEPYGIYVQVIPFDWKDPDYLASLQNLDYRIQHLAKRWGRISIMADSAGVKPGLTMVARHPELIKAGVMVSGKVLPYELDEDLDRTYPSLGPSSDMLVPELDCIDEAARDRLLFIHPYEDAMVAPGAAMLDGAKEHTIETGTDDHLAGVTRALTYETRRITAHIHS